MNKMDLRHAVDSGRGSGLVVPFYVRAETCVASGKTIHSESRIVAYSGICCDARHILRDSLDLEVDRSNRTKEGTLVDMSWDIKDIVALVQMGVMSVETAREMLGLDGPRESTRVRKQEQAEAEGMYAGAGDTPLCDDCAFFDEDENRCQVTGEERRFDQPACRQFRKSEQLEPVP